MRSGTPTSPASAGRAAAAETEDLEFSLGESDLEPEQEQASLVRQPRRQRTPTLPCEWSDVVAEYEAGSHEEEAARIAAATTAFRAVAEAQAQSKRRRMEPEV